MSEIAKALRSELKSLNNQARDVFFLFVATEESLDDFGDNNLTSILETLKRVTRANPVSAKATERPPRRHEPSMVGKFNTTEIGYYYYLMSFLDKKTLSEVVEGIKATGASSALDMTREMYTSICEKYDNPTFTNDDITLPKSVEYNPDLPDDNAFNEAGKDNMRIGQINTLIEPDNIPPFMMTRRNWVNWMTLAKRTKSGIVITKPPVSPENGNFADLTKPATFTGYATAVNSLWSNPDKYSGVTFMIDKDCNDIIGIDIDHCVRYVDGKPLLSVLALKVLSSFCDTYCELSPSGHGIRVFLRGSLPQKERRKTKVACSENDFPDQVIEWYDKMSPKALTVTGAKFELTGATDLVKLPYSINWLYYEFFYRAEDSQPNSDQPKQFDNTQPFTDDDILTIISKAKNAAKFDLLFNGSNGSFGDDSAADASFCSMLAFYTQSERGGGHAQIDSIFRKSKRMRKKWDERHYGDGTTYGNGLIRFVTSRLSSTYKVRK